MEDIIAIVMALSIPIIIPTVAIITSHKRQQAVIKQKLLKEELALEKLKQENFLLETEKLRLELEKMKQLDYSPKQKLL
ncbi:hypothetical protein OEV98_14445 [Caldibacillus lycopersici]|uniref:Uncharacterized protein n=1 Tax=Perspicuibacillus lycopersici TaxID=1325689 RepID=A0AAE3LNI2_9BACI|nr:hypothetical protein [Perspicuibacillus lycopersici]MCU9614740.1 hypothetical protein [Perspicuibacillus lycopersici]